VGCGVRSRAFGQLIQPKPVINGMDEQSGYVVGIIVGNIERQFMPAQTERTERLDGTGDEISVSDIALSYFLQSRVRSADRSLEAWFSPPCCRWRSLAWPGDRRARGSRGALRGSGW
jgi:hypothetical protein